MTTCERTGLCLKCVTLDVNYSKCNSLLTELWCCSTYSTHSKHGTHSTQHAQQTLHARQAWHAQHTARTASMSRTAHNTHSKHGTHRAQQLHSKHAQKTQHAARICLLHAHNCNFYRDGHQLYINLWALT